MKVYKKIILSLILFADILLYIVGFTYLVVGLQMPSVVAGFKLQFMGSYILFLTYLIIAVILTILFIFLLLKWRRKNK